MNETALQKPKRKPREKPFPLVDKVATLAKMYGATSVPNHYTLAWDFPTVHGLLRVTPHDRWIACQFTDCVNPEQVPDQHVFNRWSHKWNIHFYKASTGRRISTPDLAECYAELLRRMGKIGIKPEPK